MTLVHWLNTIIRGCFLLFFNNIFLFFRFWNNNWLWNNLISFYFLLFANWNDCAFNLDIFGCVGDVITWLKWKRLWTCILYNIRRLIIICFGFWERQRNKLSRLYKWKWFANRSFWFILLRFSYWCGWFKLCIYLLLIEIRRYRYFFQFVLSE